MPISIIEGLDSLTIGMDVTDLLGVVKFDPPLPANIAGNIIGHFPSEIPKTDEERVQNLEYSRLVNQTCTVTEKLDGTSCTFFWLNHRFGVCTRNYEIAEEDSNSMWQVAQKYIIKEKLKILDKSLAIQGELIGYGI